MSDVSSNDSAANHQIDLPGRGAEPAVAAHAHRGTNQLNDLNTRDWLVATKSVWYRDVADLKLPALEAITSALRNDLGDDEAAAVMGQLYDSVTVSRPPSRDALKSRHPATFAESDIAKLIRFFTKEGETVLDPFLGSGSTLVACRMTGRSGIGIEVVPRWAQVARDRLYMQGELFAPTDESLEVVQGDAREVLRRFGAATVDFVMTSPPYWSMLNKPADHKVRHERLGKGLPTRYSESADDLANVGDYDHFLEEVTGVWKHCFNVLRSKRYIAVIVSDFRDGGKFVLYHADIARALELVGFTLSGITVLVQDSKTLYPYGMPHAFVSNIHHQYVVVARKP